MSSLASNLVSLFNGQAVDVRDVSVLPLGEFREYLIDAVATGTAPGGSFLPASR